MFEGMEGEMGEVVEKHRYEYFASVTPSVVLDAGGECLCCVSMVGAMLRPAAKVVDLETGVIPRG